MANCASPREVGRWLEVVCSKSCGREGTLLNRKHTKAWDILPKNGY